MPKNGSFSGNLVGDNAQETLQLYQQMLATSGIAIITLNDDLQIIHASPSIIALTGRSSDELRGIAFADLLVPEQQTGWLAQMVSDSIQIPQMEVMLHATTEYWCWVLITVQRADAGYHLTLQDITRFKQVVDDPGKEHALLYTIANNLSDAIYALDDDGRYIFSNPAHAHLMGHREPQDIIGQHAKAILPPEFVDQFINEDSQLLNGEVAVIHSEIHGQLDGRDVWMTSYKVPLRALDGTIIGVIGVARDISTQKRSQAQLEKSEARHRILLEAMPEIMLVTRKDGIITAYHSGEEASFIHSDKQIMGQPLNETDLPQSLISELLFYMPLALDTSEMQSFEFTVTAPEEDDERTFFEARLVALNAQEVLTLIRNITPLKRIQEELSHHIEDLNVVRQLNAELSADLNFNYVVQLALDSAMRLSGAQSGFMVMVEMDGTPRIVGMVGGYDRDHITQLLQNKKGIVPHALQEQEPRLIFDVSQEPDYVPMLADTEALMVIPLISTERLVGVLVLETRRAKRFSEDRFHFLQLITGRIAAFLDNANLYTQTQEQLAELRSLYDEVRHLEQLKTDMIRIASHDLKNPLAGVLGYLEMLRMDIADQLSDMQRNYIDNIEMAGRKMQRITNSILSLERIKQLSDQTTRESVDLAQLVRASIAEQMDWVVRKEQKLVRDLPDEQVIVGADPIQLHEAISNLINNAIKYTPEEGTITVSVKVEGQIAHMRVKDTGYGIPADQQERLFSPFFRARSRETRHIEGTGLGLHLVQNIIERHDGSMFVESVYGEGSVFGFDMPLMQMGGNGGSEETLPSRPV